MLEEPTRPGAKARPDLAPHAYVYHLMFSRERVAGERVKAPRHFVLYRYMDDKVEFAVCFTTAVTLPGMDGESQRMVERSGQARSQEDEHCR